MHASVIAAILKNEPERGEFLQRLDAEEEAITSVVSVFEASMALAPITGTCAAAAVEVAGFLDEAHIRVVPLDGALMLDLAVVRDRYGKGGGHRAQLNMGDCVSYAVAAKHRARLMYKGHDFVHTDLA